MEETCASALIAASLQIASGEPERTIASAEGVLCASIGYPAPQLAPLTVQPEQANSVAQIVSCGPIVWPRWP